MSLFLEKIIMSYYNIKRAPLTRFIGAILDKKFSWKKC